MTVPMNDSHPVADMPSHPCVDKGLSAAHIRVFHGITTGLRRGHNPIIVQVGIPYDDLAQVYCQQVS